MRALLSESVLCIIHQELLPTESNGKCVACELLVATTAVRHVIKKRSSFHLRNLILTGKGYGMQTMKQSLDNLLEKGIISGKTYDRIIVNYDIR
jgi:twitching motility protein PilT